MANNEKKSIAQRMEEFTRRHQPASARRERLLALREAEQRRLAELKAQAKEKFGTDDLEALRRMYSEMEQRRDQILFDAEVELTAAEEALTAVERRINFQQA
jgi:predicted RNA-binding Zn ribbon-like protein